MTVAREPSLERSRLRAALALGFVLARRGLTAWLALALTAACVLAFGAAAFYLAHRGRAEALAGVPIVASSVLAFGIGVLAAFAVSTRALRRDEDDGVRALLRARGVTPGAYLFGRVAGLAALLGVLVGGGSLAVGLLATVAAQGRTSAIHTAQASFAAVVFSLAFALTFAPVAMATLAARPRAGGYLALLVVLVAPEALSPWVGRFVPSRWLDVCSIPGALFAVRGALAPAGVDPYMLGRGLLALAVIVGVAVVLVRAELGRGQPSGRAGESRT